MITSKERQGEKQTLENTMTDTELAMLGMGEVSYIRKLSGLQAAELFPMVTDIPEDIDLFALHSADGTPLALTDSHGAAMANAMEGDLVTLAVH